MLLAPYELELEVVSYDGLCTGSDLNHFQKSTDPHIYCILGMKHFICIHHALESIVKSTFRRLKVTAM